MLTWRMYVAAVPGMGMRPAGRFMQVRVAMFMAVFMFRIMMVIMPDQRLPSADRKTQTLPQQIYTDHNHEYPG